MRLLSSDDAQDALENIVHLDTQAAARRIDLTVAAVHRITGRGALDFGGSEFAEAPTETAEAVREHENADYGWWTLDAGAYRIAFNEQLTPGNDRVAFIQPHERLLAAGAHHAAGFLRGAQDPLRTTLIVREHGLRIKENARISTLLLFAPAEAPAAR